MSSYIKKRDGIVICRGCFHQSISGDASKIVHSDWCPSRSVGDGEEKGK